MLFLFILLNMKKILILVFLLLELYIFYYSKNLLIEEINTINICLYTLLPSMFYSIFISSFLSNLELYKILPKRLFNLCNKDIEIIILSLLSGYPNNIRFLNNSNNKYLIYSTNFVNPIFFILSVNNLYIKDIKLSLIILISHYLSNIIIFIINKNKIKHYKYNNDNFISLSDSYYKSINNTIKSLSIIFSNLLFITIFISLLKNILPFNIFTKSILIGLLEFSNGIFMISKLNISLYLKGLIILIFISFNSISIFLQQLSFNPKIKSVKFLLYKILNTIISIIIFNVIILLMN